MGTDQRCMVAIDQATHTKLLELRRRLIAAGNDKATMSDAINAGLDAYNREASPETSFVDSLIGTKAG